MIYSEFPSNKTIDISKQLLNSQTVLFCKIEYSIQANAVITPKFTHTSVSITCDNQKMKYFNFIWFGWGFLSLFAINALTNLGNFRFGRDIANIFNWIKTNKSVHIWTNSASRGFGPSFDQSKPLQQPPNWK